MAAFSAMRLLVSHGLKPTHFDLDQESKGKKKTETEDIMELLNFDALTLKEEVRNMSRNAGAGISQRTP